MILAGVVGGGGITYGVVKNADKIPVIQNIAEDNEGPSVKVAEETGRRRKTQKSLLTLKKRKKILKTQKILRIKQKLRHRKPMRKSIRSFMRNM